MPCLYGFWLGMQLGLPFSTKIQHILDNPFIYSVAYMISWSELGLLRLSLHQYKWKKRSSTYWEPQKLEKNCLNYIYIRTIMTAGENISFVSSRTICFEYSTNQQVAFALFFLKHYLESPPSSVGKIQKLGSYPFL